MINLKKKTVTISGNISFITINAIMVLLLLGSLALSLCDKKLDLIIWPEEYSDVIGVASQVVTTIISLVVSIFGIAISLQNEETFGVKVTKLYELRVVKHYSIVAIILISICFCLVNLIFYMLDLTIASIGALVASILFLFRVVVDEVPLMSKQEKSIKRIIRDNLIACYQKKGEATKDLKDTVKHLLYRETLKEIYTYFRDNEDFEYNKFLIMKLLEFQHDLAFELKDTYELAQQKIICSSMIENVIDIILHYTDLEEEQYEEIFENRHLLTRVLFRINDIPECKHLLTSRIPGLFQCMSFLPECKKPHSLLPTIMITLVALTIKAQDFEIIRAIRRHLSSSDWEIKESSPELNVFAVISMYLHFLCEIEPDTPDGLKKDIQSFIDEGGFIEEETRIKSWKKLFSIAADEFKVDYKSFINLAVINRHNLEYWLLGIGAKNVIFGEGYLTRWYLINVLNSSRINLTEDIKALIEDKDLRYGLKSLGEQCFDDDKNLVITKEMNNIVRFYSSESDSFTLLKINERYGNPLFNMINDINASELKDEIDEAKRICDSEFADNIKRQIEFAVSNEWGFNDALAIESESRGFAILLERHPKALNYEKTITNYCVDAVFNDIENGIHKTVIRKKGFEDEIRLMLKKKIKYITAFAKFNIPHYYLKSEGLKRDYTTICDSLEEFNSKLLGPTVLVVEDGFSFNCLVDSVEIRPLKEEELYNQVKKHQREDGQYVFKGVFLPKEEVTQMIKDKFFVLTVRIKHQIISSEDAIFELKPYSFEDDEQS